MKAIIHTPNGTVEVEGNAEEIASLIDEMNKIDIVFSKPSISSTNGAWNLPKEISEDYDS